MKSTISRFAAGAGLAAALTARVFAGFMLDSPEVNGGAWLSVLLGAMLSIPLVRMVSKARYRTVFKRILSIFLLPLLILDAACNAECAACSASYVGFAHIATPALLLPLFLAALRCAWLGADASASAIVLWLRPMGFLLAAIVVYQFRYYRPAWLLPVLGSGFAGIARCGLRCAVWLTVPGLAAVLLNPTDDAKRPPAITGILWAALASISLILLRQMMTPPMDAHMLTRSPRLDALLSNGRAPLYAQLPMIVLWFAGLIHLLAFELSLCAGLLAELFPSLSRLWRAALPVLASAVVAYGWTNHLPGLSRYAEWVFPVLLAVSVFGWMTRHRKGGILP